MEKQTYKKGRRAKNFTHSETSVLVTEVEKRRQVLYGPLRGPSLTQFHRDRGWEQVLSCVNAVAPTLRTVGDLKKKFKDLKSRVKAKANVYKQEVEKTGGAYKVPPFSALEKKILSFLETESNEGTSSRKNLPQNCFEEQSSSSANKVPPLTDLEKRILSFVETESNERTSSRKNLPQNCANKVPPLTDLEKRILSFIEPENSEGISSKQNLPQNCFEEQFCTISPPEPPLERALSPESIHVKSESRSPPPSPLEILETSTTSELLGQLVEEFRGFREQFGQFLQLKKRELDLMEATAKCKKERT
ncbi:uncharacterized protein [Tenebrio molitor]|uniref:uncharacterized protein n=1 Tax=Tenebrio molitor TaxID=7067 RepID=UPI0036249EA7